MGNCIPKAKLPWLISNNETLLDEDCIDPEPYHMAPSELSESVKNPMISSAMSASFIESDKRATELIRQLG